MTTSNAAESLAQLAADLEAADPAPDSPAAAFVAGVQRWLEGRAPSLDSALGLDGSQGIRKARTRWLKAKQREHLMSAWNCLDGSPWLRSVQLAKEIDRFETVIWPAWSRLDRPPANASRLRTALWEARRSGPLPGSERRLHDIVTAAKAPY